MCGIFGFIGKDRIPLDKIRIASKSLEHRGPDSSGYFENQDNDLSIVLGHRRLSIIDLNDRSNQPYYYQNSVLVFNGEIYNYHEIKKELQELGHKFLTKSDTEVLSHALKEWGKKAINKLEGMWAFAWYDKNKKILILSRDRFGEKPLYLYRDRRGIFFASEIKAIIHLSGVKPTINFEQIKRYLINGYKSIYKKKENFLNEIFEISNSTYVEVDSKLKIFEKNYWEKNFSTNVNLTYEDTLNNVKSLLINSVKKQLNSDVPLAFCMSGGIDSNSLISIAKRVLNYDVHGFTIQNIDKRYNESSIVKKSANYLGIKHTSVRLDQKNFISNLKNLINSHDSPVYTITHYLHWQLMKSISEKGYRVAISGIGADEIFTGYYDHHLFYLQQIRKNKELYKISEKNWKNNILKIVRNPFLKKPNIFFKHSKSGKHIYLNNDKFCKFLKTPWLEKFEQKKYSSDYLRNRMLNEIFHETIPVMLHEEDLNSMYYSIENRSPFLDKNLFEFSLSIPTQYLVRNGYAKAILRDSMQGIVLSKVLESTRKVGFNAPLFDLLDIKNPNVKSFIFDNSKVFELVNKKKLEKLFYNGKLENSYSKFLFNFINIKLFMEKY